jgi:alkylhydroperoxidase family enzyme
MRTRETAPGARQDPRIPDQQVRVLPAHAHARRAQGGRERGAHPSPGSLARESPLYTERERAALAWTDALTLLPKTNAPDDVYADVAAQFSEPELVGLTLAIGAINLWNRFGVGFRLVHPHTAPLTEA